MVTTVFRNFSLYLAVWQVSSSLAQDPKGLGSSTSRLQIHVPQTLHKPDGYKHQEALFGFSPYGGSIAQNVYYSNSEFCESDEDTHAGYPEREKDDQDNMAPWPTPFILMVDRGGCSFVQKVRNAQKAGAAGVIIADNQCLCSDSECIRTSNKEDPSAVLGCQSSEPIMADDGSGRDISIPSFLMFKVDAAKIKDEVKENHMVQVEMGWSIPSPDDRVEYELWFYPSNVNSKEFMKTWAPLAKALDYHAKFTPHMFIYDGLKSHCQNDGGENMCYNLCTNQGRYCSTDPDDDLESGISGADVVTESLRRICIWEHYGDEDGIGEKFWKYNEEFLSRCDTPTYFMNSDCVNDAFKQAKIDKDVIERCMHDSGGVTGDTTNQKLSDALETQTKQGIVVLPTAFVNTVPLRGALSASSVFNAICAGFLDGTQPDICLACAGCPNTVECVANNGCSSGIYAKVARGKQGVSKRLFAFSLLSVCIVFGAAGYWHWKRTQEDMREQVRGILAEYMPLEGGDEDEATNPMEFANKRGGLASLIS
eukprot:CAMPEP_0197824116 /NCGR_PEP_ID=MMETSP1437-20131217/1419_1 /TAXON_ID=49252 ORGANISM="Eucampia antarctica, Strain CCMP1452" /NCGR_SAMPLE_ID=MMETSP1437 /ASSEMBLY_ACC=CAM_ASM_001096 /LENGTH=536 /DNA_ID=CAMNT_0043423625 /DNA_START=33 /DNA_END=1643 /DNA_ORIENTATION=-